MEKLLYLHHLIRFIIGYLRFSFSPSENLFLFTAKLKAHISPAFITGFNSLYLSQKKADNIAAIRFTYHKDKPYNPFNQVFTSSCVLPVFF